MLRYIKEWVDKQTNVEKALYDPILMQARIPKGAPCGKDEYQKPWKITVLKTRKENFCNLTDDK